MFIGTELSTDHMKWRPMKLQIPFEQTVDQAHSYGTSSSSLCDKYLVFYTFIL